MFRQCGGSPANIPDTEGNSGDREVMKHWYQYRSKDRKVRGYCPAKNEEQVARLAGYPLEELIIKCVNWNGKEFVKCQTKA